MNDEMLFRRKLFGGFNREDVMEYINELLLKLKKSNEENERKDARIIELEAKLDEYEASAATQQTLPIDFNSPEEVLSQVDRLLQNYLNKEE